MGSTPAELKRDPEHDQGRDELNELRALLLGQQMVELQALQKRLDDPEVRAEELSQILGRAVVLSSQRNRDLQRSFYPIVEQAVKISITRNPGLLATSLAPIIGETVRKAVANAFRTMAESINFMLERSLSWESLKWRLEALRTGRSFGEVALLRSLRYKVQQIFLIQRDTGAVLQYLAAPGEGISEAELASSMLTAIGDFVSDAFTSKQSQDLGVVQTDDFTLWVHHGPQALLAGTIVGTPPPELKNVFAHENELIHQEFAGALASFSGDASILRRRASSLAELPAWSNRTSPEAITVVVGRRCRGAPCCSRDRVLRSSPEQPLVSLPGPASERTRHCGHRLGQRLGALFCHRLARSPGSRSGEAGHGVRHRAR